MNFRNHARRENRAAVALAVLLACCGCALPVKAPDAVQIQRGVDRSSAVQAETDKRVKEMESLTEPKR